MDGWEEAVKAIDEHFGQVKAMEHTIDKTHLDKFKQISANNMRTVFIDGGNGPLFDAPSAAVHLVRVAALEYHGAERIATHREEALCIVTRDNGRVRVRYAGQNWEGFSLGADVTTEAAADLGRRMAERAFASRFNDLVIFDGDLQSRHSVEQEALARLSAPYCGLTKTTTQLTDQGGSAAAVLFTLGPKDAWLHPLTGTTGFVKLHPLSSRAYQLQAHDITLEEAAGALLATNDPSFPGYPYGLVEADILARVSASEQRALSELLRTRMKGRWKEQAGALDSHDVLDAIAGNKTAR
jgi:hypothetical protein